MVTRHVHDRISLRGFIMKILEVRDGFIKFESNKKFALASFLQITSLEKNYVGQVIQVRRGDDCFIIYAKLLYNFDGNLQNYDGTLPRRNVEIVEFPFDLINTSLVYNDPISVGTYSEENIDVMIDKSCFNKNMLISIDNPNNSSKLVSYIANQISKKDNVVIIDMLGIYDFEKYTASIDFKLPLNTESLKFMYEDCLNDATRDSKDLIKEIFLDLSEYSKTVPFLPFNTLKAIVDDMVNKSHIFKLLVLKNKLTKFERMGYFAGNKEEAENISRILDQKFVSIDLSKLDAIFQNRYLEVIYSELEKKNQATQVFVFGSNYITKKSLKTVLTNEYIPATFITHSKFKFINEIKTLFENFIIEPSFANNVVFKTYSTFLNAMPAEKFLVVGKGTNYLPITIELNEIPLEDFFKEDDEVSKNSINIFEEENSNLSNLNILEPAKLDPQTEAIEKKSEDLINQISSEVDLENQNVISNIFDESDGTYETIVEEVLEDNNDIKEELVTGFENENFHTQVDSFKAEEIVVEAGIEDISNEVISGDDTTNVEVVASAQDTEVETSLDAIENREYDEIVSEEDANPVEILEDGIEDSEDVDITVDEEIIIPSSLEEFSINEDDSDITQEDKAVEANLDESLNLELAPIAEDENTSIEILEEAESVDIEKYEEISEVIAEDSSDRLEQILSEEDSADDSRVEVTSFETNNEIVSDEYEELLELEEGDSVPEDAILVEIDSDEDFYENESLNQEIIEDVDKVFTTIKDETLSESDLDLIDELSDDNEISLDEDLDTEIVNDEQLSSDLEEIQELSEEDDSEIDFYETLEEVGNQPQEENQEILETRSANTPIVPVFEAEIPDEDRVLSDPIEQGDSVIHAKYGTGIVEKMIKYGNKSLYSINFDNVGRRLLDPTLTEIKKS